MTIHEVIARHKDVCNLATDMKLYDALHQTSLLLQEIQNDELHTEFENCKETYSNMLNYTVKGIKDPQREIILYSLVIRIVEMADKIKEQYLEKYHHTLQERKSNAYNQLSLIQQKLNDSIESSHQHVKMLELLNETEISVDDGDMQSKHQAFRYSFFDYILYSDKLSDSDVQFIRNVNDLENILWYEKSLMVSAVTLSMMRYFDNHKMDLLFYFYETGGFQVRQRALTGILILFLLYDKRVKYYKALNEKIKKIYAESGVDESEMLILIKQLVKARDTEKLSKRMTEEIIPDIQKLTPKIEEKLDLDNLFKDETYTDKNPDWQSFLEDSPELMDKIEELSKMQLEGNDVFMSAFSLLKHFDFFKQISNWFIPFYKENPEINKILENEDNKFKEVFAESLEKSTYMCNSDKYSFMLNLKMMPAQQKGMLLNMFNAELESINELSDSDELLNDLLKSQTVYTQYIQDLYRFFKLHPNRKDFEDIFELKLDFHENSFLKSVYPDQSFLKVIADFLFKTDHYSDALDIFLVLNSGKNQEMELLQKIGYCYQQLGDFSNALNHYYKAELFDSNNVWNLKKIAFCLKKQNNYNKAIDYYYLIEKLEPENTQVQMNIANAFLHLKEFSKALNYYYKIEFSSTETTGICRPIAWCLFVLGQFAKSKDYFTRLMESGSFNKYDYMNYGHVHFVEGNFRAAADLYMQSIRQNDNTLDNFLKGFKDDGEYLLKHGSGKPEIQMMIDYLKYNL
jgi:tetratricopeptide (TPR) repeat protein